MEDLKVFFLFLAVLLTSLLISEMYKENQATHKYEICLKETKDASKCGK